MSETVAQIGNNYIGKYRRVKMMRQGKTCQIWETIRDSDNLRCVLKVLRAEFRKDKNEIGQLKHEYVIGSTLDHENCIKVYEYDVARGIPFVAIEYFRFIESKAMDTRTDCAACLVAEHYRTVGAGA